MARIHILSIHVYIVNMAVLMERRYRPEDSVSIGYSDGQARMHGRIRDVDSLDHILLFDFGSADYT